MNANGKSTRRPSKPNIATDAHAKPSNFLSATSASRERVALGGAHLHVSILSQTLNLGSCAMMTSRRSMPSSRVIILYTTPR